MISGLIELMRPLEWSKSLVNMLLAVIIASHIFGAVIDPVLFVTGFIGVALLWSGLYTLNDYTDREKDNLHEVKKKRPIPSGKIPHRTALLFAAILVIISFAIGFYIQTVTGNILFLICLAVMLVNQVLYTIKPFSFKKLPVLDLISGSIVNPLFRFYAGWVLFIPAFNAPDLALLFVVGMQFGGFALYRMSSKKLETQLGYKSSVVVFGEKPVKIAAYIALAIAFLSFIALTLNSVFFPMLNSFGFLPLKYLWLIILSGLLVPFYWRALRQPQGMNLQFTYRLMYAHTLLFIIGFIALFLWF